MRKLEIGLDFWYIPKTSWHLFYAKTSYFFKPQAGADGFHVGLFLGQDSDSKGFGGYLGYKFLNKNGFFFNLATGIGRGRGKKEETIVDPYFAPTGSRKVIEQLLYGQLHIGYRFNHRTN